MERYILHKDSKMILSTSSIQNMKEEVKSDFLILDTVLSLLAKQHAEKNNKRPEGHYGDIILQRMLGRTIVSWLDNIVIKDSYGRGRGIFAKKDLKEGQLITCYPGDLVMYDPNSSKQSQTRFQTMASERYSTYIKSRGSSPERDEAYIFKIDTNLSIMGAKELTNDPNYLGHLINDFAMTDGLDPKKDDLYEILSIGNMNCKFQVIDKGHTLIVATRNIKKDEEIFISYGVSYWKSVSQRKQATIEE